MEATFAYTPAWPWVRQRTDHVLCGAHSGPVDSVSHPGEFFARLSIEIFWRTFIMNKFSRVSVLVGAVALTALAGCASTQKHESTGQYIDDTAITTSVKAAIFNEPTLKSAEINVETFKGRVQLSGFVRSEANIERAVQVAHGVSGVTSVSNDMRLK
jgi:hypothetical protein